MPVFDFTTPSGPEVREPGFRIYWTVTVPLTVCVLCAYLAYSIWAQRKHREEDKIAREEPSHQKTAAPVSPMSNVQMRHMNQKSPRRRTITPLGILDTHTPPCPPSTKHSKLASFKQKDKDLEACLPTGKKDSVGHEITPLADADLLQGEGSCKTAKAPLPLPLAFASLSELTATNHSGPLFQNDTTLETADQSDSILPEIPRPHYTYLQRSKRSRLHNPAAMFSVRRSLRAT